MSADAAKLKSRSAIPASFPPVSGPAAAAVAVAAAAMRISGASSPPTATRSLPPCRAVVSFADDAVDVIVAALVPALGGDQAAVYLSFFHTSMQSSTTSASGSSVASGARG